MHKSRFWLPELTKGSFEGWTDGVTWNGWATPHFEFETAKKIVNEFNKLQWLPKEKAWFDPKLDQFCFVMEGYDVPECYPPEALDVDGQRIKAYPIGTAVWIWEEKDTSQ